MAERHTIQFTAAVPDSVIRTAVADYLTDARDDAIYENFGYPDDLSIEDWVVSMRSIQTVKGEPHLIYGGSVTVNFEDQEEDEDG